MILKWIMDILGLWVPLMVEQLTTKENLMVKDVIRTKKWIGKKVLICSTRAACPNLKPDAPTSM